MGDEEIILKIIQNDVGSTVKYFFYNKDEKHKLTEFSKQIPQIQSAITETEKHVNFINPLQLSESIKKLKKMKMEASTTTKELKTAIDTLKKEIEYLHKVLKVCLGTNIAIDAVGNAVGMIPIVGNIASAVSLVGGATKDAAMMWGLLGKDMKNVNQALEVVDNLAKA